MFSFDGPRQAAQRPTAGGRDSRARVVENMRALAAAGKRTKARATLTREGVPMFRALVEDAAELGIAELQVEPASVVGRGATTADGPPEPLEFAEAYIDAFRHGLGLGVRVSTAAFNIIRIGDGAFCGAVRSLRGITPDGYVSSCVEATRGQDAERNPFIVGRLDRAGGRIELWEDKVKVLRSRTGDSLPHCRTCYMVDTCAGGCMSRALAQSGTIHARDEHNCVVTRRINPELAADLAEGRLIPEPGWLPFSSTLTAAESGHTGMEGRLVALVPPFARRAWLSDPNRRPFLPAPPGAPAWFRSRARGPRTEERVTLQRMDHVGIVVDDLASATEFFVELGLEPQGDGSVEGRWVDRIVGLEGVQVDFAMMQTPDGNGRLELVKFHSPSSQGGDGHAPANAPGIRHVTFAVEDIDDVVARLQARGAELVGELERYEDIYRLCYIRGPAGIIIELAERIG